MICVMELKDSKERSIKKGGRDDKDYYVSVVIYCHEIALLFDKLV